MTILADKRVTGTGTLISSSARVLGVHVLSSGTAGSVVLKDGGGSGTTKVDIGSPAVAEADTYTFAGGGIVFGTDVHATLTNVDSVTIIYDDTL